jgi:hypothetical protein
LSAVGAGHFIHRSPQRLTRPVADPNPRTANRIIGDPGLDRRGRKPI